MSILCGFWKESGSAGRKHGGKHFIDSTKIEALANKYTFVWKKAVSKNMEKLLQKLADFVREREELYVLKLIRHNQVKMSAGTVLYLPAS